MSSGGSSAIVSQADIDNPSSPPPRLSLLEQGDLEQARRAALQDCAVESLSDADVDHPSSPPPRLSLLEQGELEQARRAALQDRARECSLDVGVAERVGKKGEDRAVVVPRFIGADDDYVAVFDGHRGSGVVTHAAATLHEELRSALLRGEPPPAACRLALARCHESAQQLGLHDGAAALALFSLRSGSEVWVFNAGDCRAVLCSPTEEGGAARRLSVDHKASVPEEQARVEAAGGTVLFGSLEGMLELSRGLGDFDFCRGGFSQELELYPYSDHMLWPPLSHTYSLCLLRTLRRSRTWRPPSLWPRASWSSSLPTVST